MSNIEQKETIWQALRQMFARGLVVMIPVVITYWVLRFLFETVDGIMGPIYYEILGRKIMGLGFITMIVFILLVGALSGNLLARGLFRLFEKILSSIPIARSIYSSMKDLMGAFQIGGKGQSFRGVVMVEYPRQGLFTVGFMTNELSVEDKSGTNAMASVYIPNPPNPTSGVMVLVPMESVQTLEMSVEEGLKLVLSGGIVTSGTLTTK
ncbi:MAG: DUF502 domain-containing protein [Ignavibacteriales bacterium]|nr:DUF502 domain-containing protein [Ignavibacteriales bacterium]